MLLVAIRTSLEKAVVPSYERVLQAAQVLFVSMLKSTILARVPNLLVPSTRNCVDCHPPILIIMLGPRNKACPRMRSSLLRLPQLTSTCFDGQSSTTSQVQKEKRRGGVKKRLRTSLTITPIAPYVLCTLSIEAARAVSVRCMVLCNALLMAAETRQDWFRMFRRRQGRA